MSKYSVTKSRHTKKGIDIWLVKPSERVDMTTYKKIESQIKLIGGYYSRFVRAFVFEKEPDTQKLDEIFGETSSISDTARQAGVSQNKVALIKLGGNWQSVDKRTLRKEYDDRKLLVARTNYFDAMTDSNRSVPENERDWSDRDGGFEREFTYSSKPYISGDVIKFGDYSAKYKSDIVQPVTITSNLPKSYNYYVDVDHDNVPNEENPYELDRVDSDNLDIQDGARVVMSLYGNKYCGEVTKKEIREYSIRTWGQPDAEIRQSVYYSVLLDNGVKQSIATFKLDTDNECDEMSVPAILKDDSYKLPESFWTNDIVGQIKKINALKRQKAARKKAEYAKQDQQWIDTHEFTFNKNAALWLGWELGNMEYSRHVTGENETQQAFRIDKWQNELGYKPTESPAPKVESTSEKKIEQADFPELPYNHPLNILDKKSPQYRESLKEYHDKVRADAEEIKPISELGSGAKVYYETKKLRVNDANQSGKFYLNVYDNTDSLIPRWNLTFDDLQTAIAIARKINYTYPMGVPPAVLLEKVVKEWSGETADKPSIHTKLKHLITLLNK